MRTIGSYSCETIQMSVGPDQLFAEPNRPMSLRNRKKQPYLENLMSIGSTPENAPSLAFYCLMPVHMPRTPELKIPFYR